MLHNQAAFRLIELLSAVVIAMIAILAPLGLAAQANGQDYSWHASDRARKVAELIPGRAVPYPPPEEFLREWTMQQVAK